MEEVCGGCTERKKHGTVRLGGQGYVLTCGERPDQRGQVGGPPANFRGLLNLLQVEMQETTNHSVGSSCRGRQETRNLNQKSSKEPTIMVPGCFTSAFWPASLGTLSLCGLFKKRPPEASSRTLMRMRGMQMRPSDHITQPLVWDSPSQSALAHI